MALRLCFASLAGTGPSVRRLRIAAVAAALAVFGGAPPAAAVAPGKNGPIAYERFIRGGGGGIRVANPDGSFDSLVAHGSTPAWSPNGRQLAYSGDGLWVQDISSGTRRRLVSGFVTDVSWSPDGNRLVFTRERPTTGSDLWTIGVKGGGLAPLTRDDSNAVRNFAPDWSPDGSRIVYQNDTSCPPACGFSGPFQTSIRVIPSNGSGAPREIQTSRYTGTFGGASWSPDGGHIAFGAFPVSPTPSSTRQIYQVNPNGSGRTQTTTLDRDAFEPNWSPQGDQLAIVTSRGTNEIWIVNRNGSGARRLPVEGFVQAPDWGGGPLLTRRLPSPPVAGKSFNAEPVSGKVYFKCKGKKRQRLDATMTLRVGCVIDAQKGKVRIVSAANAESTKTKSAVFYSGRFKVREKRSKRVVTELRLAGALGCGRARGSKLAQDARRKRRRGRRLWGKGRGRFRTRGRRSAATVRGTTWLVEDRCDGSTLTKVRKGKVRVRDFVRRKTVTVRAGHSYVAKPRRRG